MLSHVTLGSNDMSRARAFYDAVMGTLGYQRLADFGEEGMGYGPPGDPKDRIEFWVLKPFNRERATAGNGWHVAFLAPTRQAVRDFHATALAEGGRDEGAPGLRPDYHPNYYGAYVRDLDGNKLQAVCHNPE
ncbi:MAG TPA: VOC family protein [Kiloniellales bacterium]|nr:VOC family protein [Kiloniellales bacterium]